MTSLTQQHSAGQPALALLSSCALTDLTDLPRVGFRGAGSAHYLQSRAAGSAQPSRQPG